MRFGANLQSEPQTCFDDYRSETATAGSHDERRLGNSPLSLDGRSLSSCGLRSAGYGLSHRRGSRMRVSRDVDRLAWVDLCGAELGHSVSMAGASARSALGHEELAGFCGQMVVDRAE
jgi:hypothetical protein